MEMPTLETEMPTSETEMPISETEMPISETEMSISKRRCRSPKRRCRSPKRRYLSPNGDVDLQTEMSISKRRCRSPNGDVDLQTEIATSSVRIPCSRSDCTPTEASRPRQIVMVAIAQLLGYQLLGSRRAMNPSLTTPQPRYPATSKPRDPATQQPPACNLSHPSIVTPFEGAGLPRPRNERSTSMSRNAKSGDRSSSSRTAVRKRATATDSGDPVAAAARLVELLNEMESIIPDLTQPDPTRIRRV